ncbi:MAG: glycosyltransferase family 2 protein [Taibaiella sp.]|nr:glycosyltransferase family 2 protein [Taibaiella sp.]
MKSVSVITVNFNQKLVTEELLASVFATNTYAALELIVVDNGSEINEVPGWQERFPNIKFIRSEQNLGFAGGNNLGIKQAGGDYLFFVNNDTEFTPGLVQALAETLDKHPECGMVSPKIKYYDQPDRLQYAGFTAMNYYTARNRCVGQFEIDNGQYEKNTGETGFIHGAAMMLRREAIIKAGLMPENYFLYYEEMDWCERVKKARYTIWVNMQALIYHKESVSVGSKSALKEYFMNRNRILFIRRNCSLTTRIIFWFYFLTAVAPRNLLSYVKNSQLNFINVFLKAVWWNMTHSKNSNNLGYPVKNIK